MIGGYDPVIVGDKCRTDFTATEPGGKVYYNKVEFDAVPVQGGTLCTNGKWQAAGRQRLRHDPVQGLHQGRRQAPLALTST